MLDNAAGDAMAYMTMMEKKNRLHLYHLIEDQATHHPKRLFLEYQDRSWTYSEFFTDVQRVGNWLINDLGIQKGEMVALDGQNSAEWLMLWFALDGIGASISFVNCHLTGAALLHCVKVNET